jgi:hypothetical protein
MLVRSDLLVTEQVYEVTKSINPFKDPAVYRSFALLQKKKRF